MQTERYLLQWSPILKSEVVLHVVHTWTSSLNLMQLLPPLCKRRWPRLAPGCGGARLAKAVISERGLIMGNPQEPVFSEATLNITLCLYFCLSAPLHFSSRDRRRVQAPFRGCWVVWLAGCGFNSPSVEVKRAASLQNL